MLSFVHSPQLQPEQWVRPPHGEPRKAEMDDEDRGDRYDKVTVGSFGQ